jgi:hypothetical protein
MKRFSNFKSYGHAASRQRKHNHIITVGVFSKRCCQHLARLGSISEWKHDLRVDFRRETASKAGNGGKIPYREAMVSAWAQHQRR